jgi:hypothetical protein
MLCRGRERRQGPPSVSAPDSVSAWELNDSRLVCTGFKVELVVFDERRVRPAMPTVETDLLVREVTSRTATSRRRQR